MKTTERAKEIRKARYLKRVNEMMQHNFYNMYFLTFTFSDTMLKNTSQKTRERYIKEWLNEQATTYLLNCDYGTENKREHYHALIISRYKVIVSDAPQRHNIFIKAKKLSRTIYNFRQSKLLISNDYRYQTTAENLTNHAFKETTENSKIIYSRCSNKIDKKFKALADAKLKKYRESEQGKGNKRLYDLYTEQENRTLRERQRLEKEILGDLYN